MTPTLEPTILTAQVQQSEGRYIARLDALELEAEGDTAAKAQDNLISLMRSWIEVQDGKSALEETLAQAGFPGVEEDTELQLQFVE